MSDTDFVVVYVDEAAATATTTTTTTTSTTETTTSTTTTSTGPVETNWFLIAAVGVGAIVFTVVLIVFYKIKGEIEPSRRGLIPFSYSHE